MGLQFNDLPPELRTLIWEYANSLRFVFCVDIQILNPRSRQRRYRISFTSISECRFPTCREEWEVSRKKRNRNSHTFTPTENNIFPTNRFLIDAPSITLDPNTDVVYFTGDYGGFFDVFAFTYPNLTLTSVAIRTMDWELEQNNTNLERLCNSFPHLTEIMFLSLSSDTTESMLCEARNKCETHLRKGQDDCEKIMQRRYASDITALRHIPIIFGEDVGSGQERRIIYQRTGAFYAVLHQKSENPVSTAAIPGIELLSLIFPMQHPSSQLELVKVD